MQELMNSRAHARGSMLWGFLLGVKMVVAGMAMMAIESTADGAKKQLGD